MRCWIQYLRHAQARATRSCDNSSQSVCLGYAGPWVLGLLDRQDMLWGYHDGHCTCWVPYVVHTALRTGLLSCTASCETFPASSRSIFPAVGGQLIHVVACPAAAHARVSCDSTRTSRWRYPAITVSLVCCPCECLWNGLGRHFKWRSTNKARNPATSCVGISHT
jgi:hypothetical protein